MCGEDGGGLLRWLGALGCELPRGESMPRGGSRPAIEGAVREVGVGWTRCVTVPCCSTWRETFPMLETCPRGTPSPAELF